MLLKLALRSFRCFEKFALEFHPKLTIISGQNGSGKSSLLEAIQSAASLRSFRTAALKELITNGAEAFSVRLVTPHDEIHIAYGLHKRIAELNNTGAARIVLMRAAPVIMVSEYDMELVQGAPLCRRSFLDQTASLLFPEHLENVRRLTDIVRQRNALLNSGNRSNGNCLDEDLYHVLTEQLWNITEIVRQRRQECTKQLQYAMQGLFRQTLGEVSLEMSYRSTPAGATPVEWCRRHEARERKFRRSLYGAHLDDLEWQVQGMAARQYASRGMQKLLVVLARCAQAQLVQGATLLLDDVMADFDSNRLRTVLSVILTAVEQVVITVPYAADQVNGENLLVSHLEQYEHAHVRINN